ncbi:50S ribosomal protein L11 [Candidatus Micrarchaeota archaeon]|nr:50S ribosomal protein L11 [Candidatus Micrarchaeota archaeon]
MGEKILDVIVEGGKATAGPPIGPGLAPLGVNVGQVVAKINEETKSFPGLKVPVKVTVNTSTKDFTISVGVPPTSELIKKAAGVEKGTGTKDKVGNIEFSALVEIAKGLKPKSQGKSLKQTVREVAGTCVSMGISIDDKDARQIEKEISEGKYDSLLVG